MIVYKFGGASVKNAEAVKNLAGIIRNANKPVIVVMSAMGKTTNKLESILEESRKPRGNYRKLLDALVEDHLNVLNDLFQDPLHPVFNSVNGFFEEVASAISRYSDQDYNFLYDQVIAAGELVSSRIVSAWLEHEGVQNNWLDIRTILKTDSTYREAIVDAAATSGHCEKFFQVEHSLCYITQGFIGSDPDGFTTTLGREGSDYTAALLAHFLDAERVTLWKDVEGIFNADPALFKEVQKVSALNYQEVIELTYYGAKVIHPKTIKPLYDKQIPLYVKSFNAPEASGTVVGNHAMQGPGFPFIIVLENQVLISISKKDLSFVSEINLRRLFDLLHNFRIKVNLMQHSAVSFSVCVDAPRGKAVEELVEELRKDFRVLYNAGLRLITIRNYSESMIRDLVDQDKALVEQRSRHTIQFVLA